MSVLPLRRAFDEHHLVLVHRVQRAGAHLSRFVWKSRADLAVFRDVQVLQRAGTQRRADADRRIVAEQQFGDVIVDHRHQLLDAVRQVVIGKPHLVAEDHLRIGQGMGDGTGADIGIEHAGVQHEQLDEGGEAALARFQDNVLIVQVVQQRELRRVHAKIDAAPLFVGDDIEIVQPPAPAAEPINRWKFREFDHQSLSILASACRPDHGWP